MIHVNKPLGLDKGLEIDVKSSILQYNYTPITISRLVLLINYALFFDSPETYDPQDSKQSRRIGAGDLLLLLRTQSRSGG